MEYSPVEKVAIAKVLKTIMLIDNEVHVIERVTLAMCAVEIGFDVLDLKLSERISWDEAVLVLSSLSDEKKKFVAERFYDMAKADGSISPIESTIIRSMLLLADIDYPQN